MIFETLGKKNVLNTADFCVPQIMVFTVFSAFGSKNNGIYNVFVPVPRKNAIIYAVFTLLQHVVSARENAVFYKVFASRARPETAKKLLQNGPNSKNIF